MASLRAYIVRRILLAIPTILILLSVVFIVMRVTGDPITAILGGHAPPAYIEQLKERLGLNKPLIYQYTDYLWQLLHFDLGNSLLYSRPVLAEIMEHFPATLELSVSAFIISVLIGIFTGVYSARHHNKPIDHAIRLYGITTYAIFIPLLGIILQLIFSVYLGLLPTGLRIETFMEPPRNITGLYILDSMLTLNVPALISSIKCLILPSVTLGVYLSGIFTRLTRTHMIEALQTDFIRAARSRGLSERTVIYRHALKNAFIPILTMMGLQFAALLAGAVLTETTFSWPGLGTFLSSRVLSRDFTTVQGTIVFFAGLVVLVSLAVDIIYITIDPRIRY
jgi:peptide/nickel transport system permease protein